MGVADMRAAFNAVAEPRYSAQKALLRYTQRGGIQMQILEFYGSDAAGAPFSAKSDPLRPETDVNLAAAAVAQALLDKDAAK